MSLITCIKSNHGIVIASDRRLTTFDSKEDIQKWYVGTDYEQKTFLTKQNHAISYYNDAFINGIVMSLIVKDFLRVHTQSCTVEETAENLLAYISSLTQVLPHTFFIVAGYDNLQQYVLEVNLYKQNISDISNFSFVCGGLEEIALSLWNQKTISATALTIPGMIELSQFFILATNTMQRFQCTYCGVSAESDVLVLTPDSAYWAVLPPTLNQSLS